MLHAIVFWLLVLSSFTCVLVAMHRAYEGRWSEAAYYAAFAAWAQP